MSIIHERDRLSGGYVPVNVVVEFPDQVSIGVVVDELKASGCEILEVKEVFRSSTVSVMLIGDVTRTEILDLFGGLGVVRLELADTHSSRKCVKVDIEGSEDEVHEALGRLEGACEARGLTLLKPILV